MCNRHVLSEVMICKTPYDTGMQFVKPSLCKLQSITSVRRPDLASCLLVICKPSESSRQTAKQSRAQDNDVSSAVHNQGS